MAGNFDKVVAVLPYGPFAKFPQVHIGLISSADTHSRTDIAPLVAIYWCEQRVARAIAVVSEPRNADICPST